MRTRTLAKTVTLTLLIAGCSGAGVDDGTPGVAARAAQLDDEPKVVEEVPDPLANIPEAERQALLTQIPISEAASQIRAAVENGDDAGFAGIELMADSIVLWWKGALSPSMALLVAATSKTVPVHVKTAAHTRSELGAASALRPRSVRSRGVFRRLGGHRNGTQKCSGGG